MKKEMVGKILKIILYLRKVSSPDNLLLKKIKFCKNILQYYYYNLN